VTPPTFTRAALLSAAAGAGALALGGGAVRLASADVAAASAPGAAHAGMKGHGGGANGPTFKRGTVVDHAANGFNPTDLLRDFDMGTTRRLASGRTLREWTVIAADKEIEVAPGVVYPAWTYNGRVPGPTLRCREGESLRIRFVNGSAHPHTMHFHGFHRAEMDGVPGVGDGLIQPGGSTVYEFEAAGRAHRARHVRRLHHRPEAGPG
jgi:FtsP/CotA-like multicopper oxidase with cupredoxin domain